MSVLRELGRIVGCLIFCVFCVLLVPSAAWSAFDGTEDSGSSPSSSPVPESASPSEEATSSVSPSPSPSGPSSPSSAPVEPSDSSAPVPTPTVTETVTVEPSPAPAALAAETGADPVIVRLEPETEVMLLATCALVVLGVGARIVGSFGGR